MAAFEWLYLRHRDWMYALAVRTIGDRELAADAVQEAVRYWMGKFPGFELIGEVRSFLYPVIRHAAIRQAERQRRLKLSGDLESSGREAPPAPGGDSELSLRLAEAVSRLPEGQREAVHLRFADGLSLAQIALALEIPVGTVKSRLSLAMKALAEVPGLSDWL